MWLLTEQHNHLDPEWILSLMRQVGVQPLSACISEVHSTESYRPDPHLQLHVRNVLPYVQCLLYHEHEEVYEELVQQGNVAAVLAAMQFAQVSHLTVSDLGYCLAGSTGFVVLC